MVVVSYSGKEINAKLVYYGTGLSGKTTNLEAIYEAVPDNSRGKMVSMKTQSDRTLFFDLLPLDLGEVMGFKTRFLLYTVPGQVFYNATRKLVLKGADAIVFVADSERGKMDENKESLSNLRANLAEYKVNLDDLPWVLQYNKRDLPDVYTVEELNRELNPNNVPWVEGVATKGTGVLETFRLVSQMLLERVTKDLRRSPSTSGAREVPRPAPAQSPSAPQAASAGPVAMPSSPPPPTFRAAATPLTPQAPAPSPFAPVAPEPSSAPPPISMPQAPGLMPGASPFTSTSRGEIGTHPAADRADRNASAPPPLRSMQKEGPGPVMDHGTGYRGNLQLPTEERLARPAATGEPMVIPITLDGSVREIVLRIVIEQKERVDRAA